MSYIKQADSGGGDTYTLKAAQSGPDVDIQLDAAAGADSDVKLKAGTNITLTEASDTVTIDSAGAGGTIGVNQVAFGDPLNAGDIKGSDNFTFVDESGAVGADVKISGDRPTFTLEDDTGATDYKSIFRQSGSSGYWVHADSTGVDRQMIRVASRDIIINESGDDVDVRIEGDTVDNLFRTAATQDNIGIGGQPGANVQRLHVVGDSNNTSTTDAVVKIQNTLSGQTFTALELSNENDDANSDVTMRMRSNSGTDSDFEIVHDSFGGTTFLTNQPNTGTTAQMKISAGDVNVNPGSADVDMIVSSQGNSNLIRTDAANDEVGIGVAPTSGEGILQVGGALQVKDEANFQGEIRLNGAAGTAGQVLTSSGSGADPVWSAAGGGGSSLNQALNPVELVYSVAPSVIDTYLLSRTVGMTCVGSLSNSYLTRSGYSQPRFRSFIAPKTGNVDQFLVSVATANASTNFLVGIYSHTDGLPTALMGRAEMDCSSTGEVAQNTIVDASGSPATISLTQGQMYFYAWNRTNTAGDPRLHAENPAGSQWVVSQVQTMSGTDNSYNMLDTSTASSNTLPATPTANQIYLGGNTSLPLRLGIKYS